MDSISIATEIRKIIEAVGITGLVLILAASLIAFAIWWNVKNGSRTPAAVMAEAVPKITCQWSSVDRDELKKVATRVRDIDQRVEQIDREVIRISARQGRND